MAQFSDTINELLASLGLVSFDDLFVQGPLEGDGSNNPLLNSDFGVYKRLKTTLANARPDEDAPIFSGAGCYDRRVPLAVQNLVGRSDLYSAHCSKTSESARTMLGALVEYSRNVRVLTGMDIVNASLYCGGTALGHACALAVEATKRRLVLVSATINPDQLVVLERYSLAGLMDLRVVPETSGSVDLNALEAILKSEGANVAAVVVSYPNFYGLLERVGQIVALAKERGSLVVMTTELVALTALKSPKEWGADIVVGDGAPHGVPLELDKIHLGFVSATRRLLSIVPNRVVGVTVDKEGMTVPVLLMRPLLDQKSLKILPSPEILDASVALAYYAFVSLDDMKDSAIKGYRVAKYARDELMKAGFKFQHSSPFLYEFAVKVDNPSGMNAQLLTWGIVGGYELSDGLLLAFTEKRTPEEVDELTYFMKLYQFGIDSE